MSHMSSLVSARRAARHGLGLGSCSTPLPAARHNPPRLALPYWATTTMTMTMAADRPAAQRLRFVPYFVSGCLLVCGEQLGGGVLSELLPTSRRCRPVCHESHKAKGQLGAGTNHNHNPRAVCSSSSSSSSSPEGHRHQTSAGAWASLQQLHCQSSDIS
jgi:hypothetical protein